MISTRDTYLMMSLDGENYEKLVDIKTFPQIRPAPGALDVTTTSQDQMTYIEGIREQEGLEFRSNYIKRNYDYLQRLEDLPRFYSLWFGTNGGEPDGHDGKFDIPGYLFSSLVGAGVSEADEILIFLMPAYGVRAQLSAPSIAVTDLLLSITDHPNNLHKTQAFAIYVDGVLMASVPKEE